MAKKSPGPFIGFHVKFTSKMVDLPIFFYFFFVKLSQKRCCLKIFRSNSGAGVEFRKKSGSRSGSGADFLKIRSPDPELGFASRATLVSNSRRITLLIGPLNIFGLLIIDSISRFCSCLISWYWSHNNRLHTLIDDPITDIFPAADLIIIDPSILWSLIR